MKRNTFIYALCSFGLLSILSACGQADNTTPGSAPRNRFDLDMSRPDEARIAWEGYTDGYQPGATETMRLAIDNKADQAWNGIFCVELLEPKPSSVVIPLAEEEFNLESSAGFARDLSIDLPADLAPGIHGLALVVHEPSGPIVDVVPVQVGGGERQPFQGEWPTEAALDACPAPNTDQNQPSGGRITIEGVEATRDQVIVHGTTTLPDGVCVSTELWAGGMPQDWWPTDACASVQNGEWSLTVPLESGRSLGPGVQYMLRAFQPGGPNIVSTFPFDLDGPPPPPTAEPPSEP